MLSLALALAVWAPAAQTSQPIEPVASEPVNTPAPAAAPAPSQGPRPYTPVLLGPPPAGPTLLFEPVPMDLRPPPPTGKGTGLIIGAAIAGAVNVGLAAARFGLLLGDPTDAREAARFYLTTIATPIDVVAGVGLAAGAGYLRGRWDGYRSAYDGQLRVRHGAFVQSGAVLLVIGAVGYAMAWVPWDRDASIAARGGGTLLAETASSLVIMGGAGLIAYGLTWRKFAERHGYFRRIGLRPAMSPSHVGLSLAGRF